MAGGKGNEVWLIVLLVVVAAVFGVLSFTKEKPKAVTVTSADVLADKSEPSGIKPDHSEADQAAVAEMKPSSAVISAPQVLPLKTSFSVQVYSFKDKGRADAALEKLKEKGHKAFIMISDLGVRGVWYRVRVGPFQTEEEARTELDVITTEFKSGIMVTE